MSGRVPGEDELIATYFAPLAAAAPGAFGLRDDCALVACPAGEELVITVDAVAEAVHFLPGTAPEDVAWRALATSVSDLAAKGARPLVYLMAISLPASPDASWMARFADGLRTAQERFGIDLVGGDTDRRPGPLTVTITAVGSVPSGRMVRRGTARPGDRILVSGQLGDGALGLLLARNDRLAETWGLVPSERELLAARFLRPQPRLELREPLRCHASAGMDLSDGLAMDLGRMCRASGCGARVDCQRLPLSTAGRKAIAHDASLIDVVITGGDDYELLIAVPPAAVAAFIEDADQLGVALTSIGEFTPGPDVAFCDSLGQARIVSAAGWDHFGGR